MLYQSEQLLTPEASRAFRNTQAIPHTGSGPLLGLRLAVKDLIDVAGQVTGGGNPTWEATHEPASSHADCVAKMLAAGADVVGKTITDELAFSLLGENHFYGIPLNPLAPDRLPGGSSSGSASAVACGCAELALGTDTGGSVRVPASNCGLFGLRPTHGRISSRGVMPLAPSFDTVGLFARRLTHLATAAECLLGGRMLGVAQAAPRLLRLATIWDATDPAITAALLPFTTALHPKGDSVELSEIAAGLTLAEGCDLYRLLQGVESWDALGDWLTTHQPELGPKIGPGVWAWRDRDRTQLPTALARREAIRHALTGFLGEDGVLIFPTTPTLAPRIGDDVRRDAGPMGYYPRTLGVTAIAGLAGLPQLTLPVGQVDGVPIGLSLLAGPGGEGRLITVAQPFASTHAAR
ncbi:amidase [Tuwongella immobilis]|nr:amidase [Tuwongella immobilis]